MSKPIFVYFGRENKSADNVPSRTETNFVNAADNFADNAQIVKNLYVKSVDNEENTEDPPGNELNAESIENYSENINCNVEVTDSIVTQYRPPSIFDFPKTSIGGRLRRCHQKCFEDVLWLHYGVKSDSVFCHYCMVHESKLTAEYNKNPAYISTDFKQMEKAPKCFKEHENSNYRKTAKTYHALVPKCGDPVTVINDDVRKRRYEERQCLTVIMESLQYLARQGIPLRDNEDGNDKLTQLLKLRSIDHPDIKERQKCKERGGEIRRYTHHDFQDELLDIMSNQIRKKNYEHK